jgi:uncharacterized membrane protein YhaH (DUF805 family)
MQAASNPYRAPGAAVADRGIDQYSEVKILSASGRLGRLRYIGYTVGLTLLIAVFIGVAAGLSAARGVAAQSAVVTGLGYLALIAIQVMLTVQRCHDFNTSGWLSILSIIPLVNLIFWFIPGTDGPNRFGNPPPPNTTGVVILAMILPLIFILGIVAAIAIPAYQDYAKRGRAVHQQQ